MSLSGFCELYRFTTQQPNAMYINKIGGEIKFTAEKGSPLGQPLLFFIPTVNLSEPLLLNHITRTEREVRTTRDYNVI